MPPDRRAGSTSRPSHTLTPHPRRAPLLVLLTAGACWTTSAVLIAACAGGGAPPSSPSRPGLAEAPAFKAPAKPTDLANAPRRLDPGPLDDDAGNLADVFAQLRAGSPSKPGGAPTASRPQRAAAAADPAPNAAPEPASLTLAERRAAAARELRGLLTTEAAAEDAVLTDPQRSAVEAVHTLLTALERGDPPAEFSKHLAPLLAHSGAEPPDSPQPPVTEPPLRDAQVTLGTVALAQRVESFGRFVEFNSDRFVASGRAIPMLVYTEVANFMQTGPGEGGSLLDGAISDSAGGDWTVELGQELRLYAADGSEQWREPERVIRNSARSRRNDYYLVQRIELPPRLSVGKYALKVTVRDKLSGGQAERNIPFQIVADASAVGRSDAQRPTTTPDHTPGLPSAPPALITRSTSEPPRTRE